MKINNKWFSIVEIIITFSILIIISIVAVTYMEGSKDKANNSKITADIEVIKNSLISFQSQNSTLPEPSWNLKFFNLDWNYSHNLEDSDTFWVSWYIWEWVFQKKFLDKIPLDPRTNQFYAYWKTKDYNWFQIAWVISNNYEPRVKLTSNWNWLIQDNKNYSPYLVREYNWPTFVTDNSIKNYPYNPQEKLLTAKIDSFSWDILINWKSESDVLNYTFKEWDNLKVSQNWFANLYYSDWSYSMIWDSSTNSEINFKNMRFIEDNSLLTSVKIMLNAWSIWTKAVKLDDKSEFEVYTPNAVAAVRWTIFWASYNNNSTNVVVKEWVVEVKKIEQSWSNTELIPININWNWTNNWIQDWIIEVKKWENEKWVSIDNENRFNTWSILKIPNIIKNNVLNNIQKTEINLNINNDLKNDEKMGDISYVWTWSQDLLKLYKEVLNRTPNKKEFNYWMWTGWFILKTAKKAFLVEWYFNYLNNKEKYFNPTYICQAQNSFQVKNECVENTLFKINKNWKVTQFLPLDEDLIYYDSNWNSLSQTWSWYIDNNYESINLNASNLNLKKLKTNLDIYKLTNKNWEVTKWLYIDNHHDSKLWNDYLKYTIGDWWIINNYAIEISVRWWAIKRNSNYYLYHLWENKLKLWESRSKYYLSFWKGVYSNIYMGEDINNKLVDDRFYKVISTCVDNKANIYIYDKDILLVSWNWVWYCNSINNTDFFIWSNNKQLYQWDDIIDYVKVYVLDTHSNPGEGIN